LTLCLPCGAVPLLLWASSAAATVGVSGEAGLVSDYRYRGLSLSRGNPAFQASVTLEHDSGFYAQLWGSTLGHRADAEVDFTGGWSADLSDSVSIDLSGAYFTYPAAASDNYVEGTATVTMTRGDASASLGLSYAPAQRGTGHDNNLYLFGTADYAVPRTPLKLKAGLGYERGAFDEVAHGAKWDWTLGVEMEASPAKLSVAYVGSNVSTDGADRHALVASAFFEW